MISREENIQSQCNGQIWKCDFRTHQQGSLIGWDATWAKDNWGKENSHTCVHWDVHTLSGIVQSVWTAGISSQIPLITFLSYIKEDKTLTSVT